MIRSPCETMTADCSTLTVSDRYWPFVIIGRCGRASRFPNADAFASYAGVAPVGGILRSADRPPTITKR